MNVGSARETMLETCSFFTDTGSADQQKQPLQSTHDSDGKLTANFLGINLVRSGSFIDYCKTVYIMKSSVSPRGFGRRSTASWQIIKK
jgi:hypothetical protein